MKFERLYMRKSIDGTLRAEVEFSGSYGKVELVLPPETADQMLEVCADLIAKAGAEAADNLRASVIDVVPNKRAALSKANGESGE